MNIEIVELSTILNVINKFNNIAIAYKLNNSFNKLISIAVLENDTIYISSNIYSEISFIKEFVLILRQSGAEIAMIDFKQFIKYLYNVNSNFELNHLPVNIVDVKLLSDYTSISDLYDSYPPAVSFYRESTNLENPIWQVLDKKVLNSSLVKDIEFIVKHKNNPTNDFTDMNHTITPYYAYIENMGIGIDNKNLHKVGYDNVKKYFIDYDDQAPLANIEYDLNKSSTGRLVSKFHPFQSKYGDAIKSKFANGLLLSLDFKCYELKVLLSTADIHSSEKDIYQTILDKIKGETRSNVKFNIIKWMYGSSKYDKTIIDTMISHYPKLKTYIKSFRNEAIKNLSITTGYGKQIKYQDKESAYTKSVNNMIQNHSTMMMTENVKNIMDELFENKLQSHIIATVYDEIILDVDRNELDSLMKIISIFAMKLKEFNVKYYFTTKFGLTYRELKS